MTPFDRLSASLPESHDGPIGIIDSADLRAVLADAAELDRLRAAWRAFFDQAQQGQLVVLDDPSPAPTTEED